jgi:hypothetical protein
MGIDYHNCGTSQGLIRRDLSLITLSMFNQVAKENYDGTEA